MCIVEQVEAACLSIVNPGSFCIRATALTLKPPIAAGSSGKGPQAAFPGAREESCCDEGGLGLGFPHHHHARVGVSLNCNLTI
jgi:hypothetical protein